ncbi:retrovirus-related pol polyprotein from transposon TNT 1-94 [Tanacetum coccineum]
MSTQQDIYAASSKNRPPMLNKENYVPWSSRLLRYAKSRPNGKLIYNSIMNGPYVRRMIPEPGDTDREEIWLRVQQMMKGSDIGIQEKKAKLFNEWERQMLMVEPNVGISLTSIWASKWVQCIQNVVESGFQYAVQNQGVQNVGTQNGQIVVPGITNQNPNGNGNVVAARAEGNASNGNQIRCYNCRGLGHLARNCTVRPRRRDAAYLQTQLFAQRKKQESKLQAEDQASTSGTQTDNAPVYDSDGSAEVHNYDNCYDNEIFNMFTQEEQYTELLEPIPEPHQEQQNDSNVTSDISCVEQEGGIVAQYPETVEETRAYFESLYNNLALEVEKVNSVNRKMTETNADLTTELARYKNQEKCFEISQEKYDKLERCYQKSVYQEQCLTKKINALHLSSASSAETTKFVIMANVAESMIPPVVHDSEGDTATCSRESPKNETFNKHPNLFETVKILAKEADESLASTRHWNWKLSVHLRALCQSDIMSIVQNPSVENEYAKLWNDWYKKCEECKYDKISYDKAYNDMQQKIERLQAQLGDLKGKSTDTPCVSNTLDPLSQKLENENVELEFQVRNYEKEIAHLKTTYKNLFDSISVTRAQTKTIIDSLQHKLHDTIYENAKLRAQLFDKVSDQVDTTKGTSTNTKFANHKVDETNDLSKPVTSNSVPTSQESKNVIAPGMFRINPFKPSREEKYVPNKVRASVRTTPITVSQPHVVTKKDVNSDSNGLSSTGVDNTAKTRRPHC